MCDNASDRIRFSSNSAPSDPSRFGPLVRIRSRRVRDLPTARPTQTRTRPRPHSRPLGLHGITSKCVAGLYRNDFGIELRLHLGNELIESRLSRYGEAPLLLIAEEAKQDLLKRGWTELPLTRHLHRARRTDTPRVRDTTVDDLSRLRGAGASVSSPLRSRSQTGSIRRAIAGLLLALLAANCGSYSQ
jgi:hypothetical protein